ncbi:MAG TPA: hypothetical protein VJ804_12370, partial [Acidimicrobiales bacterium]|nr:hypothetical protein [Acidimicrobiales bacterium]
AAETAARVVSAVRAGGQAFGQDVRVPDGDDPRATTFGRGVPLRGRVEVGEAAPPPLSRGSGACGCECGCGDRRAGCGCGTRS